VCALTESRRLLGESRQVATPETTSDTTEPSSARVARDLPTVRIGLAAGIAGLLCCVGPTVLALLGIVSGATALAWGNNLYDGYGWLFRLDGLMLLAGLVWWSLRRRNQCSLRGARSQRTQILVALGVAVGTYAVLYALTTWLGTFA